MVMFFGTASLKIFTQLAVTLSLHLKIVKQVNIPEGTKNTTSIAHTARFKN